MKKKFLNSVKIIAVSCVVLSVAVACSNPGQTTQQSDELYQQNKVHVDTGVYVGKFGKEYIDLQLEKVKKMYYIPDEFKEKVATFKPNDTIVIQYKLDKGAIMQISSIEKSDKKLDVPQSNEANPQAKVEKKENNETTIPVFMNGNTEKQKATKVNSGEGYNIYVLDGFEFKQNALLSKTEGDASVLIEELDYDAPIKPERWNASSQLKQTGSLKELKNSKIYHPNFRNAEFVFTAHNELLTKIIVVKRYDKHLMKYTIVFPNDNIETEANFWSMINSIEFR